MSQHSVRSAIAWSSVSSLVLRAGSFAVGIVLARLLAPEQFGEYAVALTVQAVLTNLADLGLSADIVRSEDPLQRAPVVGLLGLCSGAVLAAVMAGSSASVASLMGSPNSASVIAVLALTVLLGGAGVVPYGLLQRRFAQRALFLIACVDFAISTALTISLVIAGLGALSLAVARVVAQSVTLGLQFRLSGVRPQFRLDRELVRSALGFGLPVAGANVVSLLAVNVDNIVIARTVGPVALGFYVLAFNMSSWPMNIVGQLGRAVALPYFADVARQGRHGKDDGLDVGVGLVWGLALPAACGLAVLASPLVALLYGERWHDAAPVLSALALFGAVRLLFDLLPAYLLARSAPGHTLLIQIGWFVALIPILIVATRWQGIVGAAWAHVVVAFGVVLPGYAWSARSRGAELRVVLRALAWPLIGAIPMVIAVAGVVSLVSGDLGRVALGGVTGALIYLLLVGRSLLRLFRRMTATDGPGQVEDVPMMAGVP